MSFLFDKALGMVDHLSPQQWFYVLIGLVFVAFACLRGFGSRSSY